jgi:CBS domain-containing protein
VADQKARDIMSSTAAAIGENEALLDAAKRLAELDVGAMPICAEDDRLKGIDHRPRLVVKVLAQGKDRRRARHELGAGGRRDGHDRSRRSRQRGVRTHDRQEGPRLPVIDEHRLVGIVSQATSPATRRGDGRRPRARDSSS